MTYSERFVVEPGSKVELDKIDAGFKGEHESHQRALPEIGRYCQKLSELQYLLYAEDKRSLLICLQAMDAGGKDGSIRHVVGPLTPQGPRVHCFKPPTSQEAAHDFLWRVHRQVPARGEFVIYNRSHYEDVLVVRVHELVPKQVWSRRFRLINEFEKNLAAGHTQILKFFLHISKDEQLERFRRRLDDPARHWKISAADYSERELWPQYQKAYEEALSRTSTEHAPWFVIPANRKWFRNLAISKIITETLESLEMAFPPPSVDLDEVRRLYHAAASEEEGKQ
jgi:PPK2 family polyphosphate:nucleotide phosphotransferase